MQGSNLGLRVWATAFYLMATGIKGTASMKLHRDLGITQKTAWHLAHRIRESWGRHAQLFVGPVEVDETFVGGKERNKHANGNLHAGRGAVGKTAVAGVKDRRTKRVSAAVVPTTDSQTLQGFVAAHVQEFTGRHNQREDDTLDQMSAMVRGMDGKRLRYQDLLT